jgi:hypothetical protein
MTLIAAYCTNPSCPDYTAYVVVNADAYPQHDPKCIACGDPLMYKNPIKTIYPHVIVELVKQYTILHSLPSANSCPQPGPSVPDPDPKCPHCGVKNPQRTMDMKCRVCWGLLT